MAKHHFVKFLEISAVLLFVLVIAYLVLTGVLSSTGIDHSWPYPSK